MKARAINKKIRKMMIILNKELAVRLFYRRTIGKRLNLESPKTFNEKLQWLKLKWYDERYPDLVDKYQVRKYLMEKGYGHLLNDLYGVYDDPEKIDFESLPDSFVLKGTHGCKMNLIVSDKKNLDIAEAKEKMDKWLNTNYYYQGADWIYKDIRPRIICEKNLCDENGLVPVDYKFLCFNGEPQRIQVDTDRYGDYKSNFYDTDWNYLEYYPGYADIASIVEKPAAFEEMMAICRTLAKDFIHVRVDLYLIGEEVKFGELTFFHGSGFDRFLPGRDEELGQFLDISELQQGRKEDGLS